MLGDVAGEIAHDFATVATTLSGSAHMAQHELSPSSSARPWVDQLVTEAERAAELSRQLSAFVAGRAVVPGPVDVGELVHAMAPFLQTMVRPHVRLLIESEGVLPIRACDVSLRQIIVNLARNAAEAYGSLGGDLWISARSVDAPEATVSEWRVRPSATRTRFVCLEVADNGPGMSSDTRRRIFDPSFSTKTRGHGRGLATVERIVQRFGGGLAVSSERDIGTRFQLFFPMPGSTAPESSPVAPG